MSDTIDHLVTEARKQAGISRRELARRAGISVAFTNYLEAGQRIPGDEALARIAEALDLDPVRAQVAREVTRRRRRRRSERARSPEELRAECSRIAEVAEPDDSEVAIAEKLADEGYERRRVELRVASMRRQLGWDAAEPTETKRRLRRAGHVARTWKRRFM